MATTKPKLKRAFDPAAGENALKQIEPTLRAMNNDDVVLMTMDAQEGALAALALVSIAREPKRLARLQPLMPGLLQADTIDQLELAAWATWYAHAKLQTEQTQSKGAKVSAETYEASGQHLSKLLKLLEYHVGDHPDVAVELADIRSGAGYQDRATDLVRAASLFEQHRTELEQDQRYFNAEAAQVARGYAQAIIESIRASMGRSAAEWSDLRSRAWSRMTYLYNEVRAAGEFVFRNEPEQRDLFTSLRQAVVPPRRSRKDDAADGDGTPVGAPAVSSDAHTG
jgi:hypothetical protein